MAAIPRAALDYLTGQVNALSSDAQSRVMRVLESIEWTPDNVAECRDIVVQALQAVLPTYTDAAAQAAADFYDASRETCVGEPFGAVASSGYDPDAVDGAVRALVQSIVDGKPVGTFNGRVLERVDYEMKRSAGNSMVANGARDPLKPRYARVPTGAETCAFCTMLASRGFVYHSNASAGAVNHYHANCDCRVVCGWPGMEVEGYDPEALYSDYLDGKLGTFANKRRGGGAAAVGRAEAYRAANDFSDRMRAASDLDELYAIGDEAEEWLRSLSVKGDRREREATRDSVLASLRRAASRRHGELSAGGKPGIVTYTKPRSELLEHERAGIDWLASRGYDVETIPEIGDAPANLDVRMDGEEWEMKNVTNSESSVSNQLKRARIKWYKLGSDEPMRCIVTCEGCNDEFQNVVDGVRKRLREGERIIVISQDGQIVEI